MIDYVSLCCLSITQSSKFKSLYLKSNNCYFNLHIIHHRYFLDGDRPSQTTKYILSYKLVLINILDGITPTFIKLSF